MELSEALCVLGISVILLLIWRISNVLWFKPKKIEKLLRDQGLKGSSYKFLFGDLKEMLKMTNEAKSKPMSLNHDISTYVSPFFHKMVTIHGDNCFTWIGPRPVVHLSELDMIREVLANYRIFQKLSGTHPFIKLLMGGLINKEADQWVKHRKIINPAFHTEKLKHMVPAFYVSCSEMVEKWGEITKESPCEVDVWPYLQTLSADVISRTAFGSSFEEGRKIFELQREQTELVIKATQTVYIPGSKFLPTKKNQRMKQIYREVNASIKSIIDKRLATIKAGGTSNDDLLGILLDSNYKEIKQSNNSKSGLSIEEIIEECKLFYFAGQETTGNMLVWTMILLGQHTDWQSRAREEVFNVFREKKLDINGLSHLKVINTIFNEALRLYPPGILSRRIIHEETKLGNLTLAAGTIVQVNMLFFHHSKDMWGEDANEFKPDRFSEGVSKVTKGQALYLPFSAGPRVCIGQNFALLEAKMALAMILQRFSFELSPSYTHAPHTILSLQPQFGAHLILRKL